MISATLGYFFATIFITLCITIWAARRNTGRASFYAAEGKITGTQNGFAIAGDYMSAGTVLGIVGLYSMVGVDVSLYFIAPMGGLCLGLALLVSPLRRLGRFTLGDVVQARLNDSRMRLVDRKSTRLNSSHVKISYAVFCLKKKKRRKVA